jgi:cellulose synthase/poly-beta-1,6-N-acetylglucosamine synthase-like glycosyltransferase
VTGEVWGGGTALAAVTAFVMAVGVVQNLLYLIQLGIAFQDVWRKPPSTRLGSLWARYADVVMPISLLAPAHDEETTIVENVRSMLALSYPLFEVIVINDGSRDGTAAAVIEAFDMRPSRRVFEQLVPHAPIRGIYDSPRYPRLLLIDKENGGKADALNAGINLSRSPLVCAVDADSLLEADSLLRMAIPFIADPERVMAVGGSIRIVNGCAVEAGRIVEPGLSRNPLVLFQTVEYLRAFLMARVAWSRIDTLLLISGAFGMFRHAAVVEVGGYSKGTVGEDLELVVKIHRHMREQGRPYKVLFLPEPVCWTEVPESLRILGRQRQRWQRGGLETFFKHKDMLLRPRYGRVGSLGLLHLLIVDVLGPVVEVFGYLLVATSALLGALSLEFLLAYAALTFVFGIVISVGGVVLQELELRYLPKVRHLVVIFAAAILENFGYRQLCNVWRVVGAWKYLRGAEGWGVMTRKGFRRA